MISLVVNVRFSYLFWCPILVYLFCLPNSELEAEQQFSLFKETRNLMGTSVEIQIRIPASQEAENIFQKAFQEIERVEALLSSHLASSEINTVSAGAGMSEVIVSSDVLTVVRESIRIAEFSDGAFDITFRPLWQLWKKHAPSSLPDENEMSQALKLVDYKNIQLDDTRQTLFLKNKSMSIDVGGIGKGYAVDKAVHILLKNNIKNGLVNAGGDIRAFGKNGDRPWITGIRHPRMKSSIIATLPINDEAIVTSGDYERFITINGKHYAHIIDPRTGFPVERMMSVTVIAESAMTADGLATAVFVLGSVKGLALINDMAKTETLIIDGDGNVWTSNGLKTNASK